MQKVNYTLDDESYEEQRAAGRYHPATVATFKTPAGLVKVTLSAGTADDVDARRDGDSWYFVTRNRALGYVGIEAFDATGNAVGDMFLQSPESVEDILGHRGLDLSTPTIIKRLSDYLY